VIAFGSAARWLALALLGLAIAAGVAFAASRLVSQRIGLASEPLNAGRELAPPAARESHGKSGNDQHHRGGSSTTSTSAAPSATAPAVPTQTIPPAPPSGGSASDEGGGADD
jgi:hypothetical protein